ncbi:glycoside hydrolase family 2 [Sphingobacterium alkalisoli]|uniref:Glycoside hydrolase family 2 n=1 Tax=Sphingobacterium alkalisoli TaxID=1874115 RepID=A0A4U0H4T5_9SPHI|nr:sugar-binding domain-containing protein [Sphingobacterium alkalisoli]TJY66733.1 glycoside hydrolase family 2 [Sphingobacterium alkalisoli]GGH14528.1 beta-glucuronidase [Sphingobacterium alkalisoli]
MKVFFLKACLLSPTSICFAILLNVYITDLHAQQEINLSGSWTVALDAEDVGSKDHWEERLFPQSLHLPGTLDDAGLGIPTTLKPKLEKPQLTHLTRKHRYVGAAWYAKEVAIPLGWKGKRTILKLERVLWNSQVWVDGKKVDAKQNSLIAPHYFELTDFLMPGQTHRITLRIDNRKFFDLSYENMAHAYTDHTQIIWNGVIGEIVLQQLPTVCIGDVQVYPDYRTKRVLVKAYIDNTTNRDVNVTLKASIYAKGHSNTNGSAKQHIRLRSGKQKIELALPMEYAISTWDEFNPNLYTLDCSLTAKGLSDKKQVDFGFRNFERQGKIFKLNGIPIFLRGTLECNIFPLTGYPPTEKRDWIKIFQTAKNWGLNHIRFHSWCPPKAAFAAADELGIYLQIELPIWSVSVGELQSTTEFLYSEASRIIAEYGNHPSFMLWSLGNELQGRMTVLNNLVSHLQEMDDRRLYTNTSFTFEKGHGNRPEPNDDFFVTQWTKDGWVRGQGVFNDQTPSFDKNYQSAVERINIPVVTHEIGQYAVYPNINEIVKYTGVLDPLNFKAIQGDLEFKGMLPQANDFLISSGKLAVILYKEEIERALKTKGISGFQLLDLHDFPGQGTALVGLLDAFWESKGIIDSASFARFNSPVVPLLNFEKATYQNTETFYGQIAVSNYSRHIGTNQTLEWIIQADNQTLASGQLQTELHVGLNEGLGNIKFPLHNIKIPTRIKVELRLKDSKYRNSWHIWVYPANSGVVYGDVKYTRNVDEAERLLKQGKKVLLNPDWKTLNGLEGKFVPVFWSPVHFPKQAGTMGLLLNANDAVFNKFPTDNHTDWQWWDLHCNSTTMIIDSLKGGKSLVQMIDNFANNRKLALAFEGRVGQGKLLVTSIDLDNKLEERIVAKQLLISILSYMNSEAFSPSEIKNPEWLKQELHKRAGKQEKQDATAIY